MTINRIMAAAGYVVAWFVVLPAFLGALFLILGLQALVAELAAQLFGAEKALDSRSARALASRICVGLSPLRTRPTGSW